MHQVTVASLRADPSRRYALKKARYPDLRGQPDVKESDPLGAARRSAARLHASSSVRRLLCPSQIPYRDKAPEDVMHEAEILLSVRHAHVVRVVEAAPGILIS